MDIADIVRKSVARLLDFADTPDSDSADSGITDIAAEVFGIADDFADSADFDFVGFAGIAVLHIGCIAGCVGIASAPGLLGFGCIGLVEIEFVVGIAERIAVGFGGLVGRFAGVGIGFGGD